ncbi:hypothetical protein M378DRAFT_205669 [Amanita muscaria Koide BX008]|uniref:Uncharacterized protein n=1 Tax=Amanita muscaria (strain Koide BX008) TaxID=946122 RepID=A0A0C2XA00_AMAMK|nr:hypothetical protein M378DRAFT_205669 [Amanita muscaria Koide BX008]
MIDTGYGRAGQHITRTQIVIIISGSRWQCDSDSHIHHVKPIPNMSGYINSSTFRAEARHKKLPAPYPPGPPAKPIIGNAFDIPFKKPWLKYMQLGKQFNSNIIHLSVMNTHIVVLQTIEDITELLDRRSAKYSSRMPSPIFPFWHRKLYSVPSIRRRFAKT